MVRRARRPPRRVPHRRTAPHARNGARRADALHDAAGRKHLPSAQRLGADAPLRRLRRAGAAHGRNPLQVLAQRLDRARDGQVGRRAPPRLDGRSDRRIAGRRLPDRGHDAPPRKLHARNVRRRARSLRAGLRHRARRHLRRGDGGGRRIPAHPDVRAGRESQRLGLGGDPRLHALAARALEGRGVPPLEAAALRLRWMRAAVRDAEGILARRFPEE